MNQVIHIANLTYWDKAYVTCYVLFSLYEDNIDNKKNIHCISFYDMKFTAVAKNQIVSFPLYDLSYVAWMHYIFTSEGCI